MEEKIVFNLCAVVKICIEIQVVCNTSAFQFFKFQKTKFFLKFFYFMIAFPIYRTYIYYNICYLFSCIFLYIFPVILFVTFIKENRIFHELLLITSPKNNYLIRCLYYYAHFPRNDFSMFRPVHC